MRGVLERSRLRAGEVSGEVSGEMCGTSSGGLPRVTSRRARLSEDDGEFITAAVRGGVIWYVGRFQARQERRNKTSSCGYAPLQFSQTSSEHNLNSVADFLLEGVVECTVVSLVLLRLLVRVRGSVKNFFASKRADRSRRCGACE